MATILRSPFGDDWQYQDVAARLADACRTAYDSMLLYPTVNIENVDVKCDFTPRFDSRDGYPQFLIAVTTNDASMLRGTVGFKGSYKERVEGTLNYLVRSWLPNARAYLEIRGPETGSVERLIPLGTMLSAGRISNAAPIVLCAENYQIPYVQIRGRHLIGPSTGLAVFLRDFALRHADRCRTVLDMFGGTGITAKVMCSHATPKLVRLLDNDPQKTTNMRKHISGPNLEVLDADANEFPLAEPFDLVVADPYYEDVLSFLSTRLPAVAKFARVLVFIPGNVEHGTWNSKISHRIETAGFAITRHELFGQVILEALNLEMST